MLVRKKQTAICTETHAHSIRRRFLRRTGFLWENGGPIVDLQTLVLPGSDITIVETNYINDAGEISGFGTNSNGDQRGLLLIPCDDNHPGQCEDNSLVEAPTQQAGSQATMTQGSESPLSPIERIRSQMRQRDHLPGQLAAPRD